MLKVVDNIDIIVEEEIENTSKLSLDNEFLKEAKTGTNPFRRSIYARGYQGFLTHVNGQPKIEFDNNNWITFDIASFTP
jgi:hypothetical protein